MTVKIVTEVCCPESVYILYKIDVNLFLLYAIGVCFMLVIQLSINTFTLFLKLSK